MSFMGAHKQQQTICIAARHGFSTRYLLQTDIFKTLKQSGVRIVILTPYADEEYFKSEFGGENIYIEKLDVAAYEQYSQNRLQIFLYNVRLCVSNNKMNLYTLDLRYEIFKNTRGKNTILRKIYYWLFDILVWLLRHSKLLRQFEIWIESVFFTPHIHDEIFKRYRPEKLIIPSIGYAKYDNYLMREAKRFGVSVISIVLSWDNISTKGMHGAFVDHVIAWTDTMRNELIGYADIMPQDIFVGGIAHFDYHYRTETHWTRERLFDYFGLDETRKILFFAPKSPNKYPWNPEIVELLAQAIADNAFIYPCQLVVRLHPLNYTVENGKLRYGDDLERHASLQAKYKHVFYDTPVFFTKKKDSHAAQTHSSLDMPISEMNKISCILNNTDVLLSYFSTLMLEASIFDVPMVNVGLYAHNRYLEHNDLRIIHCPHIERIIQTGGVRSGFTPEEIISYVNMYLKDRSIDREGRTRIRMQEATGPFPGYAGNKIAECITSL